MKKLFALVAILILGLAGCGSTQDSENIVVDMAAMRSLSQLPYVYAAETGMYEDAGITLNIEFFDSAPNRNAAWDTGDYDVEVADMTAGAILTDQGENIKITGSPETAYKLVASPEVSNSFSGDMQDLDGMSIGLSENTVIEFYVDIVADTYGIEFDKRPIPSIPDRYTSLISNDLDLAILPDPYPAMAEEDGAELIWTSASADIPQISALNWNENFTDYETVNTIIDVTNEAIIEMNEKGPDAYRDYAIDYNLIEADYFDAVIADNEFVEIITPTESSWQAVIDWTNGKGITSNPASYDEVFVSN